MALINCGECKAEISDQAAACPKCGAQLLKAKTQNFLVRFVLIGVILVAAFFVMDAMFSGNKKERRDLDKSLDELDNVVNRAGKLTSSTGDMSIEQASKIIANSKKMALESEKKALEAESPFVLGAPIVPGYSSERNNFNFDSLIEKMRDVLKKKNLETQQEYEARVGAFKLEPSPFNYDSLYAISLQTKDTAYDVENESLVVSSYGIFDGVPNLKSKKDDYIPLKKTNIAVSRNHPLMKYLKAGKGDDLSNFLHSLPTSKQSAFSEWKLKINRTDYKSRFETELRSPRIVILLVGRIVDDIKIFRKMLVPFDPQYLVFYSELDGKELFKIEIH